MKKIFFIVITLLICLNIFTINVKATESKSDFEFYNITYDFLNSNEYYVTYKFKPIIESINFYYYLSDENVYLDSIEHNIDDFKQDTYKEDGVHFKFLLNENKEYYLKYKGYLNGKTNKINGICIKTLSKYGHRNTCDHKNAATVDSFELRIYHPEKIKLTKDKIENIGNLIIEKDDEYYLLLGGKKYNKEYYYTVTIFKEIILKSDLEHEKIFNYFFYPLLGIQLIIIVIVIIISISNRQKFNN